MPEAGKPPVGLGRISPRFRRHFMWFNVVALVPFFIIGDPCTVGWPNVLLRAQYCVFVACNLTGLWLFHRGSACHVTAVRSAWIATSMGATLMSHGWCLGHLMWILSAVTHTIFVCVGVTLTCGTFSVEHALLNIAGSSLSYLLGPAMQNELRLPGTDASGRWFLMVLTSTAAGLFTIGALSFTAFKRKALAVLRVLSTSLSDLETEQQSKSGKSSGSSAPPSQGSNTQWVRSLSASATSTSTPAPRELEGSSDPHASASTATSVARTPSTKDSSRSVAGVKPNRSPLEDVVCKQLVGRGSFGRVYLGSWAGTVVAVKVVERTISDKFIPSFEAELAASLSHPCVVQTFKHSSGSGASMRVVDASSGEDETWIVQEWCDMGTLGSFCSQRLSAAEVAGIALDIAGGGAYLHSRGIIHGDLTANNVLLKSNPFVDKGFTCKISDFGLARILEGESAYLLTTQLGTVTHMPPELFSTDTTVLKLSTSADVYAFGMLLYQALAGEVPYHGLTGTQVVVRVASGHRLEVPEGTLESIAVIYSRCTSVDLNERPSFEELLQDFQHLADSLQC